MSMVVSIDQREGPLFGGTNILMLRHTREHLTTITELL